MPRRILLCFLVISLLCLPSCGDTLSPYERLVAFSEVYPLPAGRLYDSQAVEGEDAYLDPLLFLSLYGEAVDDREDIASYALFLGTSLSHPWEAGVFLSPDREAAEEVVGMLHFRIQMVGSLSYGEGLTVHNTFIRQYGEWVVYGILPDGEKAARTFDRAF